ncbi:MAG: hypothetical protein J2P22_20385 [Nocardioides sp.]|nr:hypothetical protein [Nocardioides sp.]
MRGSGVGGNERSGRHAAPRRAARPTDSTPVDTTPLPILEHEARVTAPTGTTRGRAPVVPLLLLALGITAAVVAWGYLVHLAIDFGSLAREGETAAWWMVGLATLGAIACLFVAMILGTRLLARIRAGSAPAAPPRPPGGRRAAR